MSEQVDLKNLKIWQYLGREITTLLQESMLELDEAGKDSLTAILLELENSCNAVNKTAGEDVFRGVMQEAFLKIMDDLVYEVTSLKKECYSDIEARDRSEEGNLAEFMLNKI